MNLHAYALDDVWGTRKCLNDPNREEIKGNDRTDNATVPSSHLSAHRQHQRDMCDDESIDATDIVRRIACIINGRKRETSSLPHLNSRTALLPSLDLNMFYNACHPNHENLNKSITPNTKRTGNSDGNMWHSTDEEEEDDVDMSVKHANCGTNYTTMLESYQYSTPYNLTSHDMSSRKRASPCVNNLKNVSKILCTNNPSHTDIVGVDAKKRPDWALIIAVVTLVIVAVYFTLLIRTLNKHLRAFTLSVSTNPPMTNISLPSQRLPVIPSGNTPTTTTTTVGTAATTAGLSMMTNPYNYLQ